MRSISLLCSSVGIAIFFSVTTIPAEDKASPANVDGRAEQELRALEETRRDAIKRGDFKTLDAIYADDFIAIAGNGQKIDKKQLMAVFGRNDPNAVFTTDEIEIRFFGDTALFTGRLVGKNEHGDTLTASRFTHVFVKRDNRWRCVAGQSTPLPKP